MKKCIILVVACLFSCQQPHQANVANENNVIEAENLHPGTKSWLIKVPERECKAPDHEFCRRPQIEGYCSQTSYFTGDTLKIFTSTDSPSEYAIDIYRMGYYGGAGGRLMKSINPLQGKKQIVPVAGKNNLIECNWDIAYKMVIPDDWTSGVYLGKLTTKPDSSQAYITFIIKDQRKAEIMFQCSDLTWQAYNRWPYWHSMYDEGQVPWVNTNGARISFDRPYGIYVNRLPMDFNPLTNGSGEFLMWEFPLAYWLEKEGYDVTYTSNIDTHADPEGLLRTSAFLSVGHDEYWTPTMYENVKQARDRGVNLLFLSGNSMDGTVYLDASYNGNAHRITGRLPQRDFDNEQELMGASSHGVGYSDFVCRETEHWVYEGTGLKDGDIIEALVGWEYHGYPLKNDTSLVVLGRSKIEPNKFRDPDAPDHAATLYETPSGSFVFNAGTCFWSLPLSNPPGHQNPVCNQGDLGSMVIDFNKGDPRIQQITKNLLHRAISKVP